MDKKFIISLDLGTTGNRVFCFSEDGKPISSSYREFTQYFPKPGWVEHDAEEIWKEIQTLIPETAQKAGLNLKNAISIGITNQRETALLWNRRTGKPVHNAIVWQCRRTTGICNELKAKGYETIFRNKTGLLLDPYFSATKIKWLLDNVDGLRGEAEAGNILFGTIDTWILWKLTGEKEHKTDYTNASRTLIYDIRKKEWSDELLSILDIPSQILPSVQNSASAFGKTEGCAGIPNGIPIGGIAGDQQSAMVGQNCVFEGTSKNTYGTGCFVLINNGKDFTISGNGLLTTLACNPRGEPVYALEGSVFIGGAVIQWLRDYMTFFNDARASEDMALSAADGDEVVFVPAFTGLGAPWWDMDARGAIFGITRDTSKEQIVKAALKSIAFQSMDVINSLQNDTGRAIRELRVDGGATANNFLMQFQADITGIPVLVPENTESTALGAAYLAGVSCGLYNSIDEIAKTNIIQKTYNPVMGDKEKDLQVKQWQSAVKRLLMK